MEGRAPAGFLRRTTLQDKLQERGYSARQMKQYQQGGLAARRFQRQERGDMWHSDIKYGPCVTPNHHDAIIDEDIFERVRQLRANRRRHTKMGDMRHSNYQTTTGYTHVDAETMVDALNSILPAKQDVKCEQT